MAGCAVIRLGFVCYIQSVKNQFFTFNAILFCSRNVAKLKRCSEYVLNTTVNNFRVQR